MAQIMNNTTESGEGNENGNVLAGFVLYKSSDIDLNRFKELMKSEWDIEIAEEVKDNSLVITYGRMAIACSIADKPIANGEAEQAASYNIVWADGAKAVAEHKAHVMVAVMNETSSVEQAILFAKVASCLLMLDGAIGVYKDPTVYEKDFYIQFARTIKDDTLPMPILIFTGMYQTDDGLNAFTSGLRLFGFNEMEVIGSKNSPDEVLNFLLAISEYVVSQEVELKDGETIGFSDDQKLPIAVSDGVSLSGPTIKINF